jgi:hypothetical protein
MWYAPQCDEVVFLGDLFNTPDHHMSMEEYRTNTVAVCNQMRNFLGRTPNAKIMASEHDMMYWFSHMPKCGGYSKVAQHIIDSALPRTMVERHLWLGYECQGWLLSHAGWIDKDLAPIKDINVAMKTITDRTLKALDTLILPELCNYGQDLGGPNIHGGPLTRTWAKLPVSEHFNQIVGHTPTSAPLLKSSTSGNLAKNVNICLDCGFSQLFWLENGSLMTKHHNKQLPKLTDGAITVRKPILGPPWMS